MVLTKSGQTILSGCSWNNDFLRVVTTGWVNREQGGNILTTLLNVDVILVYTCRCEGLQ